MKNERLSAALTVSLFLAGCGDGGNPPSETTFPSLPSSGWDSEPCNTSLQGLKIDGPVKRALRVGQSTRVEVDVRKASAGCPTLDTRDFQRLTWLWAGDSVDVRLAECPACTVEYTATDHGLGSTQQFEGSARILGPQRVVFEVTALAVGVDVLGIFAQRCPGMHCSQSAQAFAEVRVGP